ncbi:MAG: hypothetical protein ACRC1H_17855, partial [Caldilineaceae bacterium]
DPPADTSAFVLPERTAVLYTNSDTHVPAPAGSARVQTQPGGVAHIRIGDHLLDLYSFHGCTLVHLPELGLLCSGIFGGNHLPPRLVAGSDGSEEIDALRVAARMVREKQVRLLIPQVGEPVQNPAEAMERLADDVAYLQGLRRVVPQLYDRSDGLAAALTVADTLLPPGRSSAACRAVHAANVHTVYLASGNRQN